MSTAHFPRLALRSPEAAKATGICERRLWAMSKSGDLPAVRIGASVRVPVDALRRWLAEQPSTAAGTDEGGLQ